VKLGILTADVCSAMNQRKTKLISALFPARTANSAICCHVKERNLKIWFGNLRVWFGNVETVRKKSRKQT